MKRKKRIFKPQSGEMALQITSMADIFTILLVFLLKGFATSAITITPNPGIKLPVADGKMPDEQGLQVEILETAIVVSGTQVAKLENLALTDTEQKGLDHAFEVERKRQDMISKANPDVKKDERVILISDKKIPFSTVKRVLAAASGQGYTDFKLAVVQAGQ